MKKTMTVLFCFGAILLFCSCAQMDHTMSSGDISQRLVQKQLEAPVAAKVAAEVLMEPSPEEGMKVAEIDGYDYLYDRQYIFKLVHLRYPLIPTAAQVEAMVDMEIYALEAKTEGLTFSEEDYNDELKNWQQMAWWLNAMINDTETVLQEGGDDLTAWQIDYLKQQLSTAKSAKTSYEVMLSAILTEENISETQFLEQEKPYIEKYLYAFAYATKIYEDFYADYDGSSSDGGTAYMKYAEEKTEELKEKYNVKIVF